MTMSGRSFKTFLTCTINEGELRHASSVSKEPRRFASAAQGQQQPAPLVRGFEVAGNQFAGFQGPKGDPISLGANCGTPANLTSPPEFRGASQAPCRSRRPLCFLSFPCKPFSSRQLMSTWNAAIVAARWTARTSASGDSLGAGMVSSVLRPARRRPDCPGEI
jgi:hypothetical protein